MDEKEYLQEIKKKRSAERREILSLEKGQEYRFPLRGEPEEETIGKLNDALSRMGVSFRAEDGDLVITVREMNLEAFRTRGAGRKREDKFLAENRANPFDVLPEGVAGPATVHKVELLIDAVGSDAAAARLHMSKTGMYKRLRTAKAKNRRAEASDLPVGEDDLRF